MEEMIKAKLDLPDTQQLQSSLRQCSDGRSRILFSLDRSIEDNNHLVEGTRLIQPRDS